MKEEHNDKSLDVTGVGKLANAVPKEAWIKIVDTACDTFSKCLLPITSISEGVGKLIEHKFNMLIDSQKVIAAKCMAEATEKVKNRVKKRNNATIKVKPKIFYDALEETESQCDETMRELWSNLLANEIIEGSIHPEISNLLRRITSSDAVLLVKIAEKESLPIAIKVIKAFRHMGIFSEDTSFNHIHLKNLNLIQKIEGVWYLTVTGREFIRSVSDPE